MQFPPVSDPPIFKIFSDSMDNFHNFPCSLEMFRFSSAKISVLSHQLEILNFPPIFAFHYISPYFVKIIISPYFSKFPP